MRRRSKAPSTGSAFAGSTAVAGRRARGLFGLACLCVLALAGFAGSGAPAAGAAEECPNAGAPGVGFLPECRAWEMVSPPEKFGNDVMVMTTRIRAANDGSAISFVSFGGFGDVAGTGLTVEYLAERTATPAANGWATHAISPPQKPIPFDALAKNYGVSYVNEFSADLDTGVVAPFSPLTDAPNVAEMPMNLYVRDDLRSPGPGSYRLLTAASTDLSLDLLDFFEEDWLNKIADTSEDFEHVIFESRSPLSDPELGINPKLFKSDGEGVARLISVAPNCPSKGTTGKPCSIAGVGTGVSDNPKFTHRTLSDDGSRVHFTTPISLGSEKGGAAPRVFQLDDEGTTTTADDAIIQLNGSEKAAPVFTTPARFLTASTDAERVFFLSDEQLTEAPGTGLYLWERQDEDEVQELSVNAEGGSFTLTAHTQPTLGKGNLVNGSNQVKVATSGSFLIGQTVSGAGILAGTRITGMGAFSGTNGAATLTLSQAATATATNVTITADVQATTQPLPHNASAAEVEEALEALADTEGRRLLGEGNVEVSGGPGGPGAANPYEIAFTGALEGVNVRQLDAEGSGLSGATPAATVTTTNPLHNLTWLAQTSASSSSNTGALGASEDGHQLYFATAGSQLVSGAPPVVGGTGIYHWQDADGTPGGTLSFVGRAVSGDVGGGLINNSPATNFSSLARVTPDGRHLIFEVSDGSGLAPGYDHESACDDGGNPNQNSSTGCGEIYLYRAETSTPTEPDLICASCNPTGAPATVNAWLQRTQNAGAASAGLHITNALSEDGRHVFFSSAEKLVPEDTNGVEDAYLFDTVAEEPRLLSSGESPQPSYFADASSDGETVFILTRERLSGWDVDGSMDLYAARVEGGLPEPPPPPPGCQGDACQPAPDELDDTTPSSSSFEGAGNPAPERARRPRCPKGTRKARARNGKSRCVKRKNRQNRNRRANANRRAGR